MPHYGRPVTEVTVVACWILGHDWPDDVDADERTSAERCQRCHKRRRDGDERAPDRESGNA
jgi:hypothetical protein